MGEYIGTPSLSFPRAIEGGVDDFALITQAQWSALRDAGSFTTTGTGVSSNGTVNLVMAGDSTQIDGAQENYAGFDVPLLTLVPDFDVDTDRIEVYVEIASMPLTNAKYGLFCGIANGAYANRASQLLIGGGIFPNSTTVTQATQEGATSNGTAANNGTNLDVPVGLYITLAFDKAGAPRMTMQVDRSVSGLVQANVTGTPIAAFGTDPTNWVLVLGHKHVSTVSGTPVLAARVWWRLIRADRTADATLQAKPAGISSMLIMGHSIANGVGADDTTYGGASIRAGITVRNNGSTITTYPDNNGSGSDPGVLPYWVNNVAAGATVIRRSTNGQILGGIETTELPGAIADCVALGLARHDLDLVVLMIGENDSQAGEGAPFASRIDQTCQLIENAFPNARIIMQDLRTTDDTAYPERATVSAGLAAAAALKPTRRKVASASGIGLNDAVHYNLAGYATAYANQRAQWDAF